MKDPRPYQLEAYQSAAEILERDERCLLHMATGTGKTHVACMIAAEYLAAKKKVLFVAARDTLVWQASDAIYASTRCKPDIEMGKHRAPYAYMRSDCIVATIQTMQGRRRDQYERDWFDLIIIDEAHHAAAPTYRKLLDYFECPRVVGLTATPKRGDKVGLRPIFPHMAYSMPLARAVREGWLVEPRGMSIPLRGLDLSKMRIRAGDFSQDDLARAIDDGSDALAEMVMRTIEHAGDRRTLVFCATVKHAHEAAAIFYAKLGRTAAVSMDATTTNDDRRRMFHAFADGTYQYLCNVDIATEGFDDKALDGRGVQCVSIMRPTISIGRYEQMIGRGTRTVPGTIDALSHGSEQERIAAIAQSAKPDLLVLDMSPTAGRHRLITTGDVLDGKPLPDDVCKAIAKTGRTVTLHEIEKAKEHIERVRKVFAEKKQQNAQRVAELLFAAELKPGDPTPIELMAERVAQEKRDRRRRWFANRGMATAPQKELLVRRGVISEQEARNLTKYRAAELIDKSNAATDKQIWKLRSLGVDTSGVTLKRWEASKLIDSLVSKGRH